MQGKLPKFLLVAAVLVGLVAPATAEPVSSPSPSASPAASNVKILLALKPRLVFTGQTYKITGRIRLTSGISASASPSTSPDISAVPSVSPTSSGTPAPKYLPVKLQQLVGYKWMHVLSAKVAKKGSWSFTLVAPPQRTYQTLRIVYGKNFSRQFDVRTTPLPAIAVSGPGARISGVDISRWQHSILPIDFRQMARSGVGFVFIKGSDGDLSDDEITRSYAITDSKAVKAAGIYAGYYHFARVPRSNARATVIASAQKQAKQAQARLAELGGYDGQTLPYVLDIESAPKTSTDASITLWTTTWLENMYQATGRRSIVYSYRYFLANKFLTDGATKSYLRKHALWLAHPGNPGNPNLIPGKSDSGVGCYVSAWTLADCTALWSFWQYTSRGDRELYGIPWSPKSGTPCPTKAKYCSPDVKQSRKHLDLNVFNGSVLDLAALVEGTWIQATKPDTTPSPSPSPNPTPTP